MDVTTIIEADPQLSQFIDRALNGEAVILAREGQPLVRLVPIVDDQPPRVGGQWHGQVHIAEDFDQLPPDIAKPFGAEPA